jgi:predicted lipoprotein with Yx(FWY)xxD motif
VTRKRTFLIVPAASLAILALAVAGCGNGSSNNVKASPPAATFKATTPSGASASVGVRSSGLGTYLVDSQGRTLYVFGKDTGTKSMCTGACATNWPPATTSGHPKAGSKVDAAMLGTSTRSDGTSQLTYNGHPLYRYSGDAAAGDTNGQGLTVFGGTWNVISPAGQKIAGHATTSSMSGGPYGY